MLELTLYSRVWEDWRKSGKVHHNKGGDYNGTDATVDGEANVQSR